MGIDSNHKSWLGEVQNRGWIKRMVIMFIDQNKVGDNEKMDDVAGSKDEKISIIIKSWLIITIFCFEGK